MLKIWLTNHRGFDTITFVGYDTNDAAVAQSVERRIGSAEVTGPIPVSSSWRKTNDLFVSLFCYMERP